MQHDLEEIVSWLEAGEAADYRAGVLLLQEHSGNRSLVNNLLKKESATNRAKLHYELVKIGCGGHMEAVSEVLNHFAQAVQGAVPAVQQVAAVLTAQDFPAQPDPEHVPEAVASQVDALTQLMSRLHNQRCQLSNSLAELDPAEGPRVVGEILSLQNQYNALAEKRRRVVEGGQPAPAADVAGQLGIAPADTEAFTQAVGQAAEAVAGEAAPGAAPAPVVDKAALLQQRNSLRSRVSKSRKASTEAKTEEKRSEHAQKVGRLEAELSIIDLQLALPQA